MFPRPRPRPLNPPLFPLPPRPPKIKWNKWKWTWNNFCDFHFVMILTYHHILLAQNHFAEMPFHPLHQHLLLLGLLLPISKNSLLWLDGFLKIGNLKACFLISMLFVITNKLASCPAARPQPSLFSVLLLSSSNWNPRIPINTDIIRDCMRGRERGDFDKKNMCGGEWTQPWKNKIYTWI